MKKSDLVLGKPGRTEYLFFFCFDAIRYVSIAGQTT